LLAVMVSVTAGLTLWYVVVPYTVGCPACLWGWILIFGLLIPAPLAVKWWRGALRSRSGGISPSPVVGGVFLRLMWWRDGLVPLLLSIILMEEVFLLPVILSLLSFSAVEVFTLWLSVVLATAGVLILIFGGFALTFMRLALNQLESRNQAGEKGQKQRREWEEWWCHRRGVVTYKQKEHLKAASSSRVSRSEFSSLVIDSKI